MPLPAKLVKAKLCKVKWIKDKPFADKEGNPLEVQFNPQSLSLKFSNEVANNQSGGGAVRQFVGEGKTTLSLDLWFDVTAPAAGGSTPSQDDVRQLTKEVITFFKLVEREKNGVKGLLPPGIQFAWGTFLFEGIVDSLTEDLEFFSEDGKPLRAKMNLSITQQEIKLPENKAGAASGLGLSLSAGIGMNAGIGVSAGIGIGGGVGLGVGFSAGASIGMAGTQPLVQAQAGVSIQGIAAANGRTGDWKAIALANNIENPRKIETGTLINANVSGSIKMEF